MDELENQLGQRADIIRVNLQEEVGRELAPVYNITFTPTFIFFDAQGEELWREVGALNTQQVFDSLE